jgi:hypothetical protein
MSEAISSFLYQASRGLVSLKTVSFAIFRDVASTSWAVSRVHTVLTVRVETIAEAGWDFHRFPRCVYKNVIPRRGFGIFSAPIASQLIRLTLTVFVEKILQSSAKSTLLVGNQATIYHSIARARLTDKPKKVDQDRYPASSAALSPP